MTLRFAQLLTLASGSRCQRSGATLSLLNASSLWRLPVGAEAAEAQPLDAFPRRVEHLAARARSATPSKSGRYARVCTLC